MLIHLLGSNFFYDSTCSLCQSVDAGSGSISSSIKNAAHRLWAIITEAILEAASDADAAADVAAFGCARNYF